MTATTMNSDPTVALLYNDWRGPILADLMIRGGFVPVCMFTDTKQPKDLRKLPEQAFLVSSIEEAMKETNVLITALDSLSGDEDIYLADGGILQVAQGNMYFIDFSKITPNTARELNALSAVHDHHYIEASLLGLLNSELQTKVRLLVAGERADYETVLPVLHSVTHEVSFIGAAGNGVAAKLAWQVSLAGSILGLVEALAFAEATDLDKEIMLDLLTSDNCDVSSTASVYGRQIVDEQFDSGLSAIDFMSDLSLVLEAADESNLTLPGIDTVYRLFELLELVGNEGLGIVGLALDYYDEENSNRFGLDWTQANNLLEE